MRAAAWGRRIGAALLARGPAAAAAVLLTSGGAWCGGAKAGDNVAHRDDAYAALIPRPSPSETQSRGSPAATPPLFSARRLAVPPGFFARHNLGVLGADAGTIDATPAEESYLFASANGGPRRLRRVTSLDDVDLLAKGAALLVATRGCSLVDAAAAAAAGASAAASDPFGLLWLTVDDATPADLVDAAESRLNMHLSGTAEGGATPPPLFLLLDRFNPTGVRYIYDAAAAAAAAAGASVAGRGTTPIIPPPSSLHSWCASIQRGEVEPTLLAMPRLPDDVHPAFPYLSVVTGPESFSAVVLDPCADVLLEAYLTDCPMCQALAARVRMLGLLLTVALPETRVRRTEHGDRSSSDGDEIPHLPILRVAAMNVDENERPRHWMPGPAFPTVQLFNAGGRGGGKLGGPDCDGAVVAATVAAASGTAAHAPTPAPHTRRVVACVPPGVGSPPCVPSLDFSHPSQPGRMALPSVPELLDWVARNCSAPFDPATRVLPRGVADQLWRGAGSRFPEYAAAAAAAVAAAATTNPAAPANGDGGETTPAPTDSTRSSSTAGGDVGEGEDAGGLPLLALAADMEVEARVLEAGVFHAMWLGSVVEQARAVCGGPAPLPACAAVHAALPRLAELVAAAKAAVVEGGTYGSGGAAEDALVAADEWMALHGVVGAVRTAMADAEEGRAEDAALTAAVRLVGMQ